jgi:hypothetical protein
MPLATKNGSIIVKDGKLAENCGCCEGWYCGFGKTLSVSPQTIPDIVSSVSVTISGGADARYTQVSKHDKCRSYFDGSVYTVSECLLPMQSYNGSRALSKTSTTSWQTVFTDSIGNAASIAIDFDTQSTSYTVTFVWWFYLYLLIRKAVRPSFLSFAEIPRLTSQDVDVTGPYTRLIGGMPFYKCPPPSGGEDQNDVTLYRCPPDQRAFAASLPKDCLPLAGITQTFSLKYVEDLFELPYSPGFYRDGSFIVNTAYQGTLNIAVTVVPSY